MSGRANRRWGVQRDHSEPLIVSALELAGFAVVRIMDMDLVVGGVPKFGPCAGRPTNFLIECKTPKPPRKDGKPSKQAPGYTGNAAKKQAKKIAEWPGQKAVVWTPEMALRVVGAMRSDADDGK